MTQQEQITPKVGCGGLVTLAYLKARVDEGDDHLGIFMPLILDVLPTLPNRNFTAEDVQTALATIHSVAMPQETVTTLLKRAARKHQLTRETGFFRLSSENTLPRSNVASEKAKFVAGQEQLASEFQAHASGRGINFESTDEALDLILRFLEDQQVAVLLGAQSDLNSATTLSKLECAVVAEFLYETVGADPALSAVLGAILKGLVLYHAAFLPDLSDVARRFNNLTVVFDSGLVRQALGYEGPSSRALVRETIELLRTSGVTCVVFDKSVQEIKRILKIHEEKLGTPAGRRTLRASPMTRHFLTARYAPSDVQEMSVLLEDEIAAVGFRLSRAPAHVAEFTHGEAKLAERVANLNTHDIQEPRVLHDVDCIAGVLTLRRGHQAHRIEEARAVFASTSSLLIRNTKLWWEEDEREAGVSPAVHIRALANLAWLKRPTTNANFQVRELVALCAAAMHPTTKIWQRFLTHLDSLQTSQRLSSDQVTAIIVSALSDRCLREVEIDEDDPEDIDANTLDEVVSRVMSDYATQAENQIQVISQNYEQRIANTQAAADVRTLNAERIAQNAAEKLRRWEIAIEGRAQRWAKRITGLAYWTVAAVAVLGAAAIALGHFISGDLLELVMALAVLLFMVLEVAGVLSNLHRIRTEVETNIRHKLRSWFAAGAAAESNRMENSNLTNG